jgi:hypothetical protein
VFNSLHYFALVFNETRPERVLGSKLTFPITHIPGIDLSLGNQRRTGSVPYPNWSATTANVPCVVPSSYEWSSCLRLGGQSAWD